MRRMILAMAATLSMLAASSLVPDRAEAITVTAPAGIRTTVNHSDLARGVVQNIAYVCRRVWRCGPYGCGWRRACGWRPGYYAYGWYGGPYWYGRPYWRHRHWHRRWR